MHKKSITPNGEPIKTSKKCQYGCGDIASYRSVYVTSGEKYCCSRRPNQCPAIRNKNSKGVKAAVPKRRETNLRRFGVEHPMQLEENKLYGADNNMNKIDYQTIMLERYGVVNIAQIPAVAKKMSITKLNFTDNKKDAIAQKTRQTKINNGQVFKNLVDGEAYRQRVVSLTERTYRKCKHKIDPDDLRSKEYHLDHIVSICDGYNNDIPVEIISSIYNLQILPAEENFRKHTKSDMEIDILYERYNRGSADD